MVIFGATTLARLASGYARLDMGRTVEAFLVDEAYQQTDEFLGRPVINWHDLQHRYPPGEVDLFVAVGYRSMRARARAFERAKSSGYELANILAAGSCVSVSATLGMNNIVMPGAVVEPGVVLGSNNVIWSNATVCHDARIGDHNFIASNTTVGGGVVIGDRNFLGFSAVVVQQTVIGDDNLIAASALMLSGATDLGRYQGIPARRVQEIDSEHGVCVD